MKFTNVNDEKSYTYHTLKEIIEGLPLAQTAASTTQMLTRLKTE